MTNDFGSRSAETITTKYTTNLNGHMTKDTPSNATPRKMPAQKPHESKQDVETPDDLLRAVRLRFGPIVWDCAATKANNKSTKRCYFGPDHHIADYRNAINTAWQTTGLNWLNPEFGMISAFADKCVQEMLTGSTIAMLVPASTGTNWFRDFVDRKAFVLWLRPRVTFVGHDAPYPKDLMLCYYHRGVHGFECWDWKKSLDPLER